MADVYRIFGSEISPYSVKVRSYFRYKGIPHEWIERSNENMAEYQKYARIPIIPAVATPEGQGLQDSTPIIDELEAKFPEPSIHPSDPTTRFLSALIEEFGDEWGNKWMFHYRWARPVDQDSTAQRIARSMMPGLPDEKIAEMARGIVDRMVNRVYFVGSNEQTAPQIEATFREFVGQLAAHLADRAYLFGGRPAFGDFGLWGQIYNAWTDPTCKEIIEAEGGGLLAWIQRMLEPEAAGDFESWESLAPTLRPILADFVGGLYFPWIQANAEAFEAGQEEYSVTLRSGSWTQKPQKYHVRSIAALRKRYAAESDTSALDPILDETGCLSGLT
jgi:glutathione S-transferase